MVATLIRIPDHEYELYKELALEKGWSLAEWFRSSARKTSGISDKRKRSKKYSFWNIGRTLIIKGGPKDASINHDKYLYEFEEAKLAKQARNKR